MTDRGSAGAARLGAYVGFVQESYGDPGSPVKYVPMTTDHEGRGPDWDGFCPPFAVEHPSVLRLSMLGAQPRPRPEDEQFDTVRELLRDLGLYDWLKPDLDKQARA